MDNPQNNNEPSQNYIPLQGSERRAAANARLIGPADQNETFKVTIVLRRRSDGPPVPDMNYFATQPLNQRTRLSHDEFASAYGASPSDIDKVVSFATSHNLAILETNASRRTVVVSGTVAQMNETFAVSLGQYQHEVTQGRGEPVTETYRGREGSVQIPSDLSDIIIGVFGLDNRRVIKHNAADPPNTTTLSVATITGLYNFPTNSAAGQTIAILSENGYLSSDINTTFGGTPPTITDISVDASNNGNPTDFGETTQDICIAALAAPGAAIAVYFTTYSQQGWVDLIQRVVHPNAGDPVCSVLSSSFYVSDGDDTATLANEGISSSWLTAVTAAFQDAAIQGITVCIASGDTGSNSKVGGNPAAWKYTFAADNKAHVQYPGSDPWVLAVGGTTIGNVNGSTFDEYVWNDPSPASTNQWGTTGGGISDLFPLPSYQTGAGVPKSINDNTHIGRGVPDVAANASFNSGYSGITFKGGGFTGNGTSASAPLWAGLIAVMNAAIGRNIGFANPVFYSLGSAFFRDISGPPGPVDNSNAGVAGYPAGAGWDACTGWGSPNGVALLNGIIKTLFTQSLQFWVDKSTFGKDEVQDVINSPANGTFSNAFWVVLEGFNRNAYANAPLTISPFNTIGGITVTPNSAGVEFELPPSNQFTPQRIRFPFDITFTSASLGGFPTSGAAAIIDYLSASITVQGANFTAETAFEFVGGADPYFTNIDPNANNVFYLSQDLRVFTANAGHAPLSGAPAFTNDPYASIQSLLGYLNTTPAYTTPGSSDPLNSLPNQSGYETADTSVTPLNASNQQNYNFALARVRLRGSSGPTGEADNVKVFFRLFITQSFDTDFQPATTYLSTTVGGLPEAPLPSGTGAVDPSGQSIQTIPFFATGSTGTHDYDGTVVNSNVRTIIIPSGQDDIWAYFGCFLDVYNAANNSKFPGTHHCIVAQIAYDGAPIPPTTSTSATPSPENSDKLAQRNLQITSSDNPGAPATHRIPQTFDMRPSKPFDLTAGSLLNYPDELMIDWGNTPEGSTAFIYWPQINASDILQLASQLYPTHLLSAADSNTIQCKVVKGVTYVPIPAVAGKNFAGLITIDLPSSVVKGQEFNITVRRITTRPQNETPVPQINAEAIATTSAATKGNTTRNWRYIVGTFQIKIPVSTKATLLFPEENTLAILKWRLQQMSPVYRWYPVLQRYISYISARVDGLGGNSGAIKPSPTGIRTKGKKCKYTGKVSGLVYDRFGDFDGFILDAEDGEHSFKSREGRIKELVSKACAERILITVVTRCSEPHRPISIILRGCNKFKSASCKSNWWAVPLSVIAVLIAAKGLKKHKRKNK